MPNTSPDPHALTRESPVVRWLLDSDPAIRWQVLHDLLDAPADEVAAERARVATEGMGARILAMQDADGAWGGAAWNRGWNSTMHALMLLRDFGLDPASAEACRAVELARDHVVWQGWGPNGGDNPFFAGEGEPCINGQLAAAAAYFGQDVSGLIERLVGEQLADGGWNCEAENGSTRASFNTTICVLEALLAYEQRFGASEDVTTARLRGEDYLLARRLFRRLSTGEVIGQDRKDGEGSFTRFAFPTWWHYDVLRALEYMRRALPTPDMRLADAIDLVASKRGDDGRWLLERHYPGVMLVETDAGEGQPSKWITLRALRVLKWFGATTDHRPPTTDHRPPTADHKTRGSDFKAAAPRP